MHLTMGFAVESCVIVGIMSNCMEIMCNGIQYCATACQHKKDQPGKHNHVQQYASMNDDVLEP